MPFLSILFLLIYFVFIAFIIRQINHGKMYYLLIYLVTFLPVYITFLSFIYAQTDSVLLTRMIQYSKEFVLFYGLGVWLFGQRKPYSLLDLSISGLDWLFILFLLLTLIFFILPVGEATFFSKATYLKNILLMSLVYFFGRQVKFEFGEWRSVFKLTIIVTGVAFVVVILERFYGTHFHSIIGYVKYYAQMLKIEPSGNYGLNWTFEAQGGQPRYGSIFANPLEFAASMLISVAIGVFYLLNVRPFRNRQYYLAFLLISLICIFFAFSRASMLAVLIMLAFIALLIKYYKIFQPLIVLLAVLVVYVTFIASDEVRYFALDTIMFRNSSSLTHLVDWLTAIDSIITNPLGIGLAMSGNAGGVEDGLRVGGENQFLVFGVQLGVLGMLIYILIIILSIRHSWLAYRRSTSRKEQLVPFVAASVKFGLLLALITANAEIYLYVSLVSWWMVGASETIFQKYNVRRRARLQTL